MKGTPESKAEDQTSSKFDLAGVLTFMIAMIALQIVVTQGNNLGWTSPLSLSLSAVALVFGWLFFWIESRIANAFVDLKLFHNPDLYRRNNLELHAQWRRRHFACLAATRPARWQYLRRNKPAC